MTPFAAKLKTHFENVPLSEIVVSGWPVDKIYYRHMTLAQREIFNKDFSELSEEHGACTIIMDKALDVDGKPLFDGEVEDRAILMGACPGPDLVMIADRMTKPTSVADKKKS